MAPLSLREALVSLALVSAGSGMTLGIQFLWNYPKEIRRTRGIKKLLDMELNLAWFDATGLYNKSAEGYFPLLTDIWDSVKLELPSRLPHDVLKKVHSAYYSIKELKHRVLQNVPDLFGPSEECRNSIQAAVDALGMTRHGRTTAKRSSNTEKPIDPSRQT